MTVLNVEIGETKRRAPSGMFQRPGPVNGSEDRCRRPEKEGQCFVGRSSAIVDAGDEHCVVVEARPDFGVKQELTFGSWFS